MLVVHDLFGKPVSTFPDHARRTRGPSLPGWSELTGSNVLPRPRKPGLELRPRAESPDGKSRGGTPIGERAPSLPSPASGGGKRDEGARRIARCGGWLNTSVGVPLPFSFVIALCRVGRAKRNPPLSMVGYAAFAANPPYIFAKPGRACVAGTRSLIRPRAAKRSGRGGPPGGWWRGHAARELAAWPTPLPPRCCAARSPFPALRGRMKGTPSLRIRAGRAT